MKGKIFDGREYIDIDNIIKSKKFEHKDILLITKEILNELKELKEVIKNEGYNKRIDGKTENSERRIEQTKTTN